MKIYHIRRFLLVSFILASRDSAQSASHAFIDSFLTNYQRAFTLLLLGDDMASRALKLAATYPQGLIVVVAEDKEKKLLSRIEEIQPKNIIFFQKRPTREELEMLTDCEHFDVTCCGTFLSSYSKTKKLLGTIKNAGDYLIICPEASMRLEKIHNFLSADVVRLKKNDFVYVKKLKKDFVKRKWWGAKKTYTARKYYIKSNFREKYLIKLSIPSKTKWVNGINLTTFYMFNAVYPSRADVVDSLEGMQKISHYDKSMTNIIIKGRSVELIDFSDPKHAKDKHKLKSVIAAFKGEVYAYNKAGGGIRYEEAG